MELIAQLRALVQLFGRTGRGGGISSFSIAHIKRKLTKKLESSGKRVCLRKSLLPVVVIALPQFSLPTKLGILESNPIALPKRKRHAH